MTLPEPIAVTLAVTDALERLRVPYFIGGSLASAAQGAARSTLDADIIADLAAEDVQALLKALAGDFYCDADMIGEAIRNRSSFNLIHLATMFKVDIFINKGRPFDQSQFERRVLQSFSTLPPRSAYIASPEDTILSKLVWYRLGGEASDRQWGDTLSVLRAQEGRLDDGYLALWAGRLGVTDLLDRAKSASAQ
jgi:hypothetical protein